MIRHKLYVINTGYCLLMTNFKCIQTHMALSENDNMQILCDAFNLGCHAVVKTIVLAPKLRTFYFL